MVPRRGPWTYPTRGYKKAFARPDAKSIKEGATERACRSPTLFREDMAKSSTVFKVRRRSDTSSMGSNGGLQRASSTTARSQGGTRDRTLGLSLITPRRKRVVRGSLPTDCPPIGLSTHFLFHYQTHETHLAVVSTLPNSLLREPVSGDWLLVYLELLARCPEQKLLA